MIPLAPADRTRLARVLGMLGSPHQGERDAAALAADRLVRGRGLDWLDVLGGSERAEPISRPGWTAPPTVDHMADVRVCQRHFNSLTTWEMGFISDLAQRRSVTQRQREVLAAIAAKVRTAGSRAG